MDRKTRIRELYKTRLVSSVYAWFAGPTSVAMFSDMVTRDFLPRIPSGADVLEVGSGPGLQALDLVRKRPDLRLVASDFSPRFVEMGRRNHHRQHLSTPVTFTHADAMDLGAFGDASFDGVYSFTAIRHFPDPARGLREMRRVLKPGGTLLVTEFHRDCSLVEIENVAAFTDLPAFLRPAVARLVHGLLPAECPSLDSVGRWLEEAELPVASLRQVPGLPLWVVLAEKV